MFVTLNWRRERALRLLFVPEEVQNFNVRSQQQLTLSFMPLLDRHALREIPRFIHVAT
jgi:hypothetical protein